MVLDLLTCFAVLFTSIDKTKGIQINTVSLSSWDIIDFRQINSLQYLPNHPLELGLFTERVAFVYTRATTVVVFSSTAVKIVCRRRQVV